MSPEAYLAPDEKRLLTGSGKARLDFGAAISVAAWLPIALMISVVLLQLFVQYRLNF